MARLPEVTLDDLPGDSKTLITAHLLVVGTGRKCARGATKGVTGG